MLLENAIERIEQAKKDYNFIKECLWPNSDWKRKTRTFKTTRNGKFLYKSKTC